MHKANFDPVPASARAAREFVRRHLTDYPDEGRDLAALLVSELATNAIVHVGQPFQVQVATTPCIWVGVDDPSSILSEPGQADIDATHGRGLLLVAVLADQWGIEPTDTGKRAWFELFSKSI